MCSVGQSDPKMLSAIDQVETENEIKSYFEVMASCILPYDPVENNKACANNNYKHIVSNTKVDVLIIRGRDQETKTDHRFYDIKECDALSKRDKFALRQWHLVNPNEFGQSKKKCRHQEKGKWQHLKILKKCNDDLKAYVQPATDKFIKGCLKGIGSDDQNKVSFKLDGANATS